MPGSASAASYTGPARICSPESCRLITLPSHSQFPAHRGVPPPGISGEVAPISAVTAVQDRTGLCRGRLKAKALREGKRGFQMEVSYYDSGQLVQITAVRKKVVEIRGARAACRMGYRARQSNRGR